MPGGAAAAARIWVAQVGRVPLLLLDTDVEENTGVLRDITDRLYGGNTEHRLRQEMLLGIGGVRAIRAYSELTGAPEPEVFHTNEGHAGFLGLERIRELTEDKGLDFDAALEVSRAGTVFTTHTPVPAGIDRFPRDLVEQYFGGDNASAGVPVDRILALGAEDFEGGDPARLQHGGDGASGWPSAPTASPSCTARSAAACSAASGPASTPPSGRSARSPTASTPPPGSRREVFDLAREQGVRPRRRPERRPARGGLRDRRPRPGGADLGGQAAAARAARPGRPPPAARVLGQARAPSRPSSTWIDGVLDPDVLTIGFARRVPSYKRLTLMLRDPDRLKSILLHPERPVQLVIAGKAHPADDGGKRLIQEIVRFADDPEVRHRIVFLPNYDIAMAQPLYPGCDVWLNNPLRPYEACGTSGMKAALNGGLNLSILDGWWDEWFDGNNGWAIPSADGVDDDERRDDLESAALYDLIENDVAPRFYDHDENGAAGPVDRDGAAHAAVARPQGARRPDGGGLRQRRSTPRRRRRRARSTAVRRAPRSSRRGSSAWSTAGPASASTTSTPPASVTPPRWAPSMSVHAFVSLGDLSPDDVDVQAVHGRVARRRTTSSTPRRRR